MQQEMMNSHTSYPNTLQRRFFNRNDLKNTEDYSKHHFGKPKITMKTINVVAAIILDEGCVFLLLNVDMASMKDGGSSQAVR